MNKARLYILSIVTGLILVSCKTDPVVPEQSRIYTSYSVTYDNVLNKTSASAVFSLDYPSNLNSNKLKLTHPASISYFGKELLFDSEDFTYKKEFLGEVENTFEYINYHDTKFFNTINIPDSVEITGLADSADITADFYIQWAGKDVVNGENIVVSLTNLDNGKSFFLSFHDFCDHIIEFDGDDITNLGTGKVIVQIARYISKSADQKPLAGGSVLVKYQTEDTLSFY